MSPRPPNRVRPQKLRIEINSACSSNGDFSAGSLTPSSATTFSLSPTSSLSVNPSFPGHSTPGYVISQPPTPSAYTPSRTDSVKEEPFTPGFLTSSDDNDGEATSPSEIKTPPKEEPVEPKTEPKLEVDPPIKKRGRGRPRKNPTTSPETKAKVAKGRSKTGCLTCRKRKKKCDEGKPECSNCSKNGYICEGYNPRQYWRGGRDQTRTPFKPSLPALIEGVESQLDRRLLNHFVGTASPVFTMFGEEKSNPFKEVLLPLAIDNPGLMHSLLSLAASHLARTDPSVRHAQYHHKDEAIKLLNKGLSNLHIQEGTVIDDSYVATTIVLCLEAICEGDNTGAHTIHMTALNSIAENIVKRANTKGVGAREMQFAQFFIDFFHYHMILDGVTSMARRASLVFTQRPIAPFLQPEAGTLIGTLDQLFVNISRITTIRDTIRARKAAGNFPTIDEVMLATAVEIDEQVRTWTPAQTQSQPRYIYSLLYQQVTWIYLYRTINRSVPDPKIRAAVDEGVKCLNEMPVDGYSCSVLLLPVFLLGCAAFDPAQRPDITKRLEEMKREGLQNATHAQVVVDKIWEKMDDEDETSWDWERIIHEMGYDFVLS